MTNRSERWPEWPRMMLRRTAAAYCDLSEAGFEREVAGGVLPMPVILGRREHWDRVAIDSSLDLLSGTQQGLNDLPDWRLTSKLYNDPPAPPKAPKLPQKRKFMSDADKSAAALAHLEKAMKKKPSR